LKSKVQKYDSVVYGPTEFKNVEFGNAKALTGYNTQRIIIDGHMSVNLVESVKYGREVHIQVYSSEHRVERRNPSKWSRTEIYFPVEALDRLIEALIKIKIGER